MAALTIRPMTPQDVPEAERVSAEGLLELAGASRGPDQPAPERRTGPALAVWLRRTLHLVHHDPGGCWVAEDDGGLVGMVTSMRRETLWCLAGYAVRPSRQGQGIGTQLLLAARSHGRGCTRAMVSALSDPRAARAYHRAGFALHPQMRLSGTVDRAAIPVVDRVREGSASDVDLMDSLDRAARGAGHGVDHQQMLEVWRLLVSDTSTGSGYAYLDERGRVAVLAADNRRTATRLLWAALADGPARTTLGHLTGANQWALDVGLRARLRLGQEGYLGLRGMRPPTPYVHHGVLL